MGILRPDNWTQPEIMQALWGCLGYFFFVLGLFNGLILFSLNQGFAIFRTLIIALLVNIVVGYTLAHTISVFYCFWFNSRWICIYDFIGKKSF